MERTGGCLASGGLRQRGYGEHYAGYGVDEEGLEAAYDAGAYSTARSTRATAVSPRAYDSERSTSTSMARCNLRLFCLRTVRNIID